MVIINLLFSKLNLLGCDVFYGSFIKKTSHILFVRPFFQEKNKTFSFQVLTIHLVKYFEIILVILKFSDFYPFSLLSLDAFREKLTRGVQSAHGFAEIQLLSQVI